VFEGRCGTIRDAHSCALRDRSLEIEHFLGDPLPKRLLLGAYMVGIGFTV
jgi:hypothetical protein